jgi:hypothetical protein
MSDVSFRVNVHEPDGSVGLIELTPAMEDYLYQAGAREMETSTQETFTDSEGGIPFISIEWDNSLTEVTLGGSQVPPGEAAEAIGLGVIQAVIAVLNEA